MGKRESTEAVTVVMGMLKGKRGCHWSGMGKERGRDGEAGHGRHKDRE